MVIDTLVTKIQDKMQRYVTDKGECPSAINIDSSYSFTGLEMFRDIPVHFTSVPDEVWLV